MGYTASQKSRICDFNLTVSNFSTAWNLSEFEIFSGPYYLYLEWIRRFTLKIYVLSPNTEKYFSCTVFAADLWNSWYCIIFTFSWHSLPSILFCDGGLLWSSVVEQLIRNASQFFGIAQSLSIVWFATSKTNFILMIRVCLTQIFDKRKNSTSRVFQDLLGTLYLKKTLYLKFLALLLTHLNPIFQPYKNRTYKNHIYPQRRI